MTKQELFKEIDRIIEENKNNVYIGDGYDCEPVNLDSANHAKRFIELLSDIVLPDVSNDNDGAISLDWWNKYHWILTVSFEPNSKLCYAWLIGDEKNHGVEVFVDFIPQKILDTIKRIGK